MKKTGLLFFLMSAPVWAFDFVSIKNDILGSHPELDKAKATLEGSKALARPGHFQLFPTVTLNARRDWLDFKDARSEHQDFYGVTGTINLYKNGADFFSIRAANSQLDKAEKDYEMAILEAESNVTKTLFNFVRESQSLKIAELKFESKKKILDIADLRFRKGLIPREEFDKVDIELRQAEAQFTDAKELFLTTKTQLSSLMKKPGGLLADDPAWPWKGFISDPNLLKKIGTKELAETPDYQSAVYNLQIAENLKGKALGLMGPSLDINTTYGKAKNSGTWEDSWTLSLGLSFPIFEKLSTYSVYQQQRENVIAAKSDLMISQRDGSASLENTKTSLELARLTALSRSQMAEKSKDLYNKSMQLFRNGRTSVNDLSLDEDRWLLSQSLEVQGWASAHLALLNYYQARGLKAHDTKVE